MRYNTRGWVWEARDGWAFCKGDEAQAPAQVRQFKQDWPGASVNTHKRRVRAGGISIPLTVVVVRQRVAECTCGEEKGRRPAYLATVCGYCEAKAET